MNTCAGYRGRTMTGLLGLGALLFSLQVTADPEQQFKQCQVCHAIGADAAHGIGPQLNGLAERTIGAAEGYDYSSAFASWSSDAGLWEPAALDEFLLAPMDLVPGTKMAFLGIKNDENRAMLVEWLLGIDAAGVIPEAEAATGNMALSVSEEPRPLAADVPVPEHGVLHLGRVALEEEISAWDIDIRPDGAGLPAGQGSVEAGGELYDAQCAVCHGVFGEGEGRWPILAGGHDTLTDDRPEKTIGSYWPYLSTVFDYVKRAMPFGNARSLSDDDVYAITAYLLYLNDLVEEEDFVLSADNFQSISLPNEANFVDDDRAQEPHYAAGLEPCMQDCKPDAVQVTQRARILDVTPEGDGESAGGSID